ncbi:hypothetical protein SUGI_0296070 [Cryptomeria japonica]|nr:hypothetical protein SUGI_0296070 [Cryptomeria japonica]
MELANSICSHPEAAGYKISRDLGGLLKKAFELSVLCEVDVALIVFNTRGKVYEYCNKDPQKIIEKYKRTTNNGGSDRSAFQEKLEAEEANLRQQIEVLTITNKHLVGEKIENMNRKQLRLLEQKIDKAFSKVRKRKEEVMRYRINLGKEKEDVIKQENDNIRQWIMEKECYQRTNMLLAQPEYDVLPAYGSQNFNHANLISAANHFASQEKTTLQLG